jgi:hypothetical protein
MTAIKEFERLEALGLWRETANAQRREVVISFGDSTLILSDINNSPLAHWSLAAIEYKGSAENGSIFSVDDLGEETLEIDDSTMIAAIGKVRASIDATRPHPGRLRWFISAITLLLFLGVTIFWLPNALTKYAASIVPESKSVQIGDSLIKSIQKTTGSICSTPSGERALRRFEDRVIGAPSNRVRILEMGTRPSVHLPGGNILLNHRLTTQSSDANLLAGYAIMERAAEDEKTPLLDLFNFIGIRKTLGFLGTGGIGNADLEAFADWRLFGPHSDPSMHTMLELFTLAKVPFSAYATHAKNDELLRAQDLSPEQYDPILSDNDWISLQEICGS